MSEAITSEFVVYRPSAGRKFFLLGLKTLHSFWSRTTTKNIGCVSFPEFGVAQVSPIQHRSPLVLLARDARASACARLRFLPWQPGWEIRVSGSDVYPTLRGGSATARLRFFRLACVADQKSRSAARIVFATLRGGSDFRDCNENTLLFFSSTQAGVQEEKLSPPAMYA